MLLDIVHLSLLNVLRNSRRTILTLLSIATGFVALVCFGGFVEFSFVGLRETIIRTQVGHFQIHKAGYQAGHLAEPEEFLIEDPDEIEDALSELEDAETVVQRFSFSGLASTGNSTVNVSVIGIDPKKSSSFSDFEILLEGRQIRRNDTSAGVVGEVLMQGLGAEIGDWATMIVTTIDGVINAVDFEIVGVVSTGSQAYDEVYVKIPLELAQRARDTEDAVEIVVLLEETEKLDKALAEAEDILAASGRKFETTNWLDVAPYYHRVVALYSGLFNVFSVIVGIVVMFSVANAVTMSIFERTPEIGALRAIGATRSRILVMLLLEGLIVGILGCIVGIILSVLVTYFVEVSGGISIPAPPGMSRGYQAEFLLTYRVIFIAAAITIVSSIVSSIYPSVAASRMSIIKALDFA